MVDTVGTGGPGLPCPDGLSQPLGSVLTQERVFGLHFEGAGEVFIGGNEGREEEVLEVEVALAPCVKCICRKNSGPFSF